MRLCSACLLGINCRYDGKSKLNEKVLELVNHEILIPFCPEQLGGLSTPRSNVEIYGGDGYNILEGSAKVIEPDGKDVSCHFVLGARETLKLAQIYRIDRAIIKQRSPSCGCGKIYDGTFSRTLIDGYGVTAAFLKRNGIEVISEEDL